LAADEGEDERQAGREVDEPVEQAGDEEEQSAQAEQRERRSAHRRIRFAGDRWH